MRRELVYHDITRVPEKHSILPQDAQGATMSPEPVKCSPIRAFSAPSEVRLHSLGAPVTATHS